MKKIIILGCNGQLGTDLMKVFHMEDDLLQNFEVLGLKRSQFDVLSANSIHYLDAISDIAYIINTIALTDVDGCESNIDNAFLVNAAFASKLAIYCQRRDITLFHISTDYVFDGMKSNEISSDGIIIPDGTNSIAYVENDVPNPLSIYGLSKYAGELAVKNYQTKFFIFRVCALFGVTFATGKGGNFITTMLSLAQTKDSFQVIEDQYTNPTHTLDIARCIKSFIMQNITDYGIYHCASSTSCSWYQFARDILTLVDIDPDKVKPISFANYKFKAKRPQYGVLDTTRLAHYYHMPDYLSALREYLLALSFFNLSWQEFPNFNGYLA